jgi:hypothetical protein
MNIKLDPLRMLLIGVPTVVLSIVIISLINNRFGWVPIVLMLIFMLVVGIFGKFKDYDI